MNENILFANEAGIVISLRRIERSDIYDNQVLGMYFWDVLGLGEMNLEQALCQYPVDSVHTVSLEDGEIFFRIVVLPPELSPKSGFMIICTDIGKIYHSRVAYQEQLEKNLTALEDSTNLYASLFENINDAAFIANQDMVIVAANPAAGDLLEVPEIKLVGAEFNQFVRKSEINKFKFVLSAVEENGNWTGRMDILSKNGRAVPVELVACRVELTEHCLIQVILKDLTEKKILKQGLERKMTEVEGMNMAMKKLIQYVEEGKRELKDELVQQVKSQLLPTVERMAESRNPEQRTMYKRVIKSQIADISKGSQDKLDRLGIILTPREIEVCRLILLGKKGIEISDTMGISFETLQTHRKNIRKKLDLTGKRIGLASYLLSLDD